MDPGWREVEAAPKRPGQGLDLNQHICERAMGASGLPLPPSLTIMAEYFRLMTLTMGERHDRHVHLRCLLESRRLRRRWRCLDRLLGQAGTRAGRAPPGRVRRAAANGSRGQHLSGVRHDVGLRHRGSEIPNADWKNNARKSRGVYDAVLAGVEQHRSGRRRRRSGGCASEARERQ